MPHRRRTREGERLAGNHKDRSDLTTNRHLSYTSPAAFASGYSSCRNSSGKLRARRSIRRAISRCFSIRGFGDHNKGYDTNRVPDERGSVTRPHCVRRAQHLAFSLWGTCRHCRPQCIQTSTYRLLMPNLRRRPAQTEGGDEFQRFDRLPTTRRSDWPGLVDPDPATDRSSLSSVL